MNKALTLLLVLNCSLAWAQAPLSRYDSIGLAHAIDKDFSGAILVAQDGKIAYEAAYGMANAETELTNSLTTQFPIASVTKFFTALVIMQLVEEGELKLEATLADLLPNQRYPNAKQITVHHLLLHAAGLPYTWYLDKNQHYDQHQVIRRALRKGYWKPRFESHRYSDTDYLILGEVIGAITQDTWENQVQKRILDPLGMRQTGFHQQGILPEDLARTYSQNRNGEWVPDPSIHWENFHAAGNMYSTVYDLLKLDQGLREGEILTQQSQETMYAMHPEWKAPGYSVWTYKYPFVESQPRLMERRGGIMGANCVLVRGLEENTTVIVLSNTSAFNPDSFGDPTNLREALIMEAFR
ncbi:MAG: serine hydrolase domain-containing protein [Bacteroidota bacterium]